MVLLDYMKQTGGVYLKGFTIVELLIVVVILAVLAAITVVAFNGVQDRAKKAVLATELGNISKQLKHDQIVNGNYPATLAAANNGAGVKTSAGTILRYTVNNTTNPQTFCVTATDGKFSYMITHQGVAGEGGCVNVALGASSPAALLTDGVTTSNPYYSGTIGLVSVTVTLPTAQDISSVKVWHYYADGRTYYATKTEVSADGVAWATVFDSATSGTYAESAAGKTHSFPLREVKYIRDWLNGSKSNTGNHWVEIQAY